jgi:hypothetical protein
VLFDIPQICEVARVSQAIQIYQALDLRPPNKPAHQIGTDETRPTSNQQTHRLNTKTVAR